MRQLRVVRWTYLQALLKQGPQILQLASVRRRGFAVLGFDVVQALSRRRLFASLGTIRVP